MKRLHARFWVNRIGVFTRLGRDGRMGEGRRFVPSVWITNSKAFFRRVCFPGFGPPSCSNSSKTYLCREAHSSHDVHIFFYLPSIRLGFVLRDVVCACACACDFDFPYVI
jgi:hypothetical protein